MIYDNEARLTLRQIENILLGLEDFPDFRISPFCVAHKAALNTLPTSIDKTAMLAQFITADDAYQAGISKRDISIYGRSEDVVLFTDQEKKLSKRMSVIKRLVLDISDERSTLVFFNMTNLKFYTQGRQWDIVKNIRGLSVQMASRPDYTTVVPIVDALLADLGGIFGTKTDQVTLVDKNKEDIDPLVQNLKAALFFNKGKLTTMFSTDQTRLFLFFPKDIMLGKMVHPEDYVKTNQVFIVDPPSSIINVPKPAFNKRSIIIIDNLGPDPIQAYKSITISSVIPEDAINILGFSKFVGVIGEMGSDLADNLMLAFPGLLANVKVRITIKKPKKNL